jgi:hypothetical protein
MILRHWNFCGRPDRRNFPCLFLPLAPPKVDHFATSRIGAALDLNSARHLVGTIRLLRHPRPSDLLQNLTGERRAVSRSESLMLGKIAVVR